MKRDMGNLARLCNQSLHKLAQSGDAVIVTFGHLIGKKNGDHRAAISKFLYLN